MKRRTLEGRRKFGDIIDRATKNMADFGIEPDYGYRVSVPSANDVAAKVTITLPYVRWLGRVKVPPHENH